MIFLCTSGIYALKQVLITAWVVSLLFTNRDGGVFFGGVVGGYSELDLFALSFLLFVY